MTPKGKTSNSTTLWIERKVADTTNPCEKVHVAGGDHRGIIINKETKEGKRSKFITIWRKCQKFISESFQMIKSFHPRNCPWNLKFIW